MEGTSSVVNDIIAIASVLNAVSMEAILPNSALIHLARYFSASLSRYCLLVITLNVRQARRKTLKRIPASVMRNETHFWGMPFRWRFTDSAGGSMEETLAMKVSKSGR